MKIQTTKEGKKAALILISAMVAVLAAGYWFGYVRKEQIYEAALQEGKAMLAQNDLEAAREQYTLARDTYINRLEPYVKLYEIYLMQTDEEAAQSLWIAAQSNLSEASLESLEASITEMTKARPVFLYQDYMDIVAQAISTYGQGTLQATAYRDGSMEGLCLAMLADLDGSGLKELVLVVPKKEGYQYRIYQEKEGQASLSTQFDVLDMDGQSWIWIAQDSEGIKTFVSGQTETQSSLWSFYSMEGAVQTLKAQTDKSKTLWYSGQKEISQSEYESLFEQYTQNTFFKVSLATYAGSSECLDKTRQTLKTLEDVLQSRTIDPDAYGSTLADLQPWSPLQILTWMEEEGQPASPKTDDSQEASETKTESSQKTDTETDTEGQDAGLEASLEEQLKQYSIWMRSDENWTMELTVLESRKLAEEKAQSLLEECTQVHQALDEASAREEDQKENELYLELGEGVSLWMAKGQSGPVVLVQWNTNLLMFSDISTLGQEKVQNLLEIFELERGSLDFDCLNAEE